MAGGTRSGLVTARNRKGHTQESLAHALGVELSTVGRWERALCDPQPWMWPRIAKELGITTDELADALEPITDSAYEAVTTLKALLRQRHSQTYPTFKRLYEKTARTIDSSLVATSPTKRQYYRWLNGQLSGLPHPGAQGVLEAMFPGYTAQQLFEPWKESSSPLDSPTPPGSMAGISTQADVTAVSHIREPTNGDDYTPNCDDSAARPGLDKISVSIDAGHLDGRSVEATLLAASDETAEFLAWAEVDNVGDLTVEQIHADIRRVAHSYLKAPTMPLFDRTRKLRDRVFGLLAGHQSPVYRRELYSAAGWCLTILAWMTTDLGHAEMAKGHLRAAWLCAENADQNNLRAWVRATQHTAAFWQRDYWAAAQYAESGLSYATTGTTELYLSSALALDLALYGNSEASRDALTRAQAAADSWGARSISDELAGPFTCSVGRAGGFWSDTHLALSDASKALYYADSAVSAFESTPDETRNLGSERMVRCQQVKARILLGELDGAAEALNPVLATAPEHRVGPLAQRVHEIMQMADTRQGKAPMASQIKDATIEFGRVSPRKSLPQGSKEQT